jgi:hypothetical protein
MTNRNARIPFTPILILRIVPIYISRDIDILQRTANILIPFFPP